MAARITAYLVALIVGTTFIAGLIVGAQRSDDGPVDLIVVNGNVYTADVDNPTAEAIAVQGNKIVMVGSNRDVQRLRRAQTVVVDAKGGTVLPGFNDTQLDLLSRGLALQEADLEAARTLPEIEATVRAWVAGNVDRPWVTGRGWSADVFPDGLPTRQMLDAIVPDRPAFFIDAEGGTAWANSAALTRAGITRRTPNPDDGTIVKEPRTGEPTGILKESAVALISALVPEPGREQRLAALRAAIEEARRRGVTSVQTTSGSAEDLALFDELRRSDDLDVRVYASLPVDPHITAPALDILDQLREKYSDDPLFKTGGVTVVVDDASTERWASSGLLLQTLVADLDKRGWQVMIRAAGDGAVALALDAFEYALRQNPRARERRHRIETAETTDAPDVARVNKAGVTVSLPEVADPLLGLQLAIDSVSPAGGPGRGMGAATREPVEEAIDAYTRDAAWASFDEHRKGVLKRDMLADIVVLSRDLFSPPPSRPAETDVSVTIFNGKVVFSRAAETNE
jgi:predicted amidohydrolase YtcJ